MTTRDRLIETAMALIWERGYIGTSPRAIQELAGVGQGSMYHHFSGKSELIAEAVNRTMAALRQSIEDRLEGPGSVMEKIERYLYAERDILKGCSIGRLTYDPAVLADPQLKAPVEELFLWQQQLLTRLLADGIASGELVSGFDPENMAATIAATLQGSYVLARAAGEAGAFYRSIDGLMAVLRSYGALTA